MTVGNLEIVPIVDGTSHLPIENAVQHPDGKIWDCADHPTDEDGRIRPDIGSFLIQITRDFTVRRRRSLQRTAVLASRGADTTYARASRTSPLTGCSEAPVPKVDRRSGRQSR